MALLATVSSVLLSKTGLLDADGVDKTLNKVRIDSGIHCFNIRLEVDLKPKANPKKDIVCVTPVSTAMMNMSSWVLFFLTLKHCTQNSNCPNLL